MENIHWLVFVGIYVYYALTLQLIANKTGTANAWMAWVPIANGYLMCKVANRPGWWLLLMLIPFVNIVITVIVWMGIAKARHKPAWLGVVMLVPIANLIIPAHLALSE
jgi:hypothetical protein